MFRHPVSIPGLTPVTLDGPPPFGAGRHRRRPHEAVGGGGHGGHGGGNKEQLGLLGRQGDPEDVDYNDASITDSVSVHSTGLKV